MSSFISATLTAMVVGLASANPFTLTAFLPGNAINGQVVNAANEALFLGLPGPLSYCPVPPESPSQCPAGTMTLFIGTLSMWVEVPGGEMCYVAPDGEIKYTGPHSAYMPPGSFEGGFVTQNILLYSDCSQETLKLINWEDPGTNQGGIYACPNVPPYVNATYQIYAKTPAFNQTDCIELKGLLQNEEPNNDYGAWEYT